MIKLEAGHIYQVKHWEKGWIIAEYVKAIAAHSYRYNNLDMMTCTTGPERVRNVPLSHQWKKIGYGSLFTVEARGMQICLATEETLATIIALKTDIQRLDQEQQNKRRELRELCN